MVGANRSYDHERLRPEPGHGDYEAGTTTVQARRKRHVRRRRCVRLQQTKEGWRIVTYTGTSKDTVVKCD